MMDTTAPTPADPEPPRSTGKAWWILGGGLTVAMLLAATATVAFLLWTLPPQ